MGNHVSEAVRQATTKCAHKFSCLSTGKCGDRAMCQVSYDNGKDVLFLAENADNAPPPSTGDCPYRISYFSGQVCRCPMHYELVMKKCGAVAAE